MIPPEVRVTGNPAALEVVAAAEEAEVEEVPDAVAEEALLEAADIADDATDIPLAATEDAEAATLEVTAPAEEAALETALLTALEPEAATATAVPEADPAAEDVEFRQLVDEPAWMVIAEL